MKESAILDVILGYGHGSAVISISEFPPSDGRVYRPVHDCFY